MGDGRGARMLLPLEGSGNGQGDRRAVQPNSVLEEEPECEGGAKSLPSHPDKLVLSDASVSGALALPVLRLFRRFALGSSSGLMVVNSVTSVVSGTVAIGSFDPSATYGKELSAE